jgi:hypothetical protein
MTIEEYKKLLATVQDPDIGASAILTLTDALEVDLANVAKLKTDLEVSTETINTLRDTNSKLILRITSPIEQTQLEEPETPESALEDLKTAILKED